MARKDFHINDWLSNSPTYHSGKTQAHALSVDSDTETVIRRIESANIDITADYQDWLNIGFAFGNEYGESGRQYFHRISKFNPEYSSSECDRQFTNCLNSKGSGINIDTFFYLAKNAGVSISCPSPARTEPTERKDAVTEQEKLFDTPSISPAVYRNLPEILKDATRLFDDKTEKDLTT